MSLSIALIIDIIGIIIGVVSITSVLKTKKSLGGAVGKGLSVFIWGVLFMILAFLYTIVFSRLKLLGAPPIDVHHALMTIGMILFVIAAQKFAKSVNTNTTV
jgi:tellurite resistance protein TehA-like permease